MLEDGKALYAPRGELPYDPVEDQVQCHLCGGWDRALGPHLRRHGWTADEYRCAVGLSPRRALQSPSVSKRRAAIARALVERDPRVRAGMAIGVELARSGELPAAGTAVMSRELARPQLFAIRSRQGRAMGLRRAEAYRGRRELRAREIGYPNLAAYLQRRYVVEGALVADLARELRAAVSAVVGDMDRAAISRRSRGEARSRAHAARRARRAGA